MRKVQLPLICNKKESCICAINSGNIGTKMLKHLLQNKQQQMILLQNSSFSGLMLSDMGVKQKPITRKS
jgi:UDP-N-acetylmuramoylalanine-D-glutamate ligase